MGTLTTYMSKAFDSMHSALLLSKLRAYGATYATVITELKLASQKSSWRRVNRGCPQGSAFDKTLKELKTERDCSHR